MPKVIEFLKEHKILLLNDYNAHFYEINKMLATDILATNGIDVPYTYGIFSTSLIPELQYPVIIKPNCGGRTNLTYIIKEETDIFSILDEIASFEMIVQKYIQPEFITRIEVIDKECKLILKRSVCDNGLSAYKYGSTYEFYPDCSQYIKNTAIKVMDILDIQMGSMDIIEYDGKAYIIDVNSVSNTSEDCTELFQFDLMLETAKFIFKKCLSLENSGNN
ncbi:MAG: hypothetical protein ATN35_01290 [Epulopiscium sp. Nele67-Bin004]|nr:MAG: hypothetical protein ATN35_01290 [Epulopiscium sp. Nele67-Bin004]